MKIVEHTEDSGVIAKGTNYEIYVNICYLQTNNVPILMQNMANDLPQNTCTGYYNLDLINITDCTLCINSCQAFIQIYG